MLLVKSNETIETTGLANERDLTEMGRFNDELTRAGVVLSSEGLLPSARGARVRIRGGEFTVTKGPFAEPASLVAGFWMVRTKSKDDARRWLERVPPAAGEVELRPLYEPEDFPVDAAEQEGGWRDQEIAARDAFEAKPPARLAGTKRFILMLKADTATESGRLPTEDVLSKMGALMEQGVQDGSLLGGDGLKPSSAAVKVKTADGRRTLVDGPFAETKELVAGYTLLQLRSLDDAIAFAKRWLDIHVLVGVTEAEIEIRELMELQDMPVTTGS
ncbi:MAG TPA: YciI family protein [Polyangiaceae bacterium]|nr:YciI family protein [Polyangiaceae bacterium]